MCLFCEISLKYLKSRFGILNFMGRWMKWIWILICWFGESLFWWLLNFWLRNWKIFVLWFGLLRGWCEFMDFKGFVMVLRFVMGYVWRFFGMEFIFVLMSLMDMRWWLCNLVVLWVNFCLFLLVKFWWLMMVMNSLIWMIMWMGCREEINLSLRNLNFLFSKYWLFFIRICWMILMRWLNFLMKCWFFLMSIV